MSRVGRLAKAVLLGLAALTLVAASPRKTYLRTLDDFTGEIKIYRGFDTALILRATYLDAPMRRALAEERARLINPAPDNQQAFLARMKADQDSFHDVVFSASTGLPGADRFGESDASWMIWLEADGTREKLVQVDRIRRPTPLHRELYAHITVWSELWIARFEKTVDDPDEVVFHVGSGYGNGDVRWKDLNP